MSLTAGLMVRDGTPGSEAYPPNMEIPWSQFQPSAHTDFVTTELDNAIASGQQFRLRLMCGRNAPTWLKTEAGSFTYTEPNSLDVVTVPKWWTAAYIARYIELMGRIQVTYDGILSCLSISGCMTYYDEPCQRGVTSGDATAVASNISNMLAAGYSKALDISAQQQVFDAHTVFTHTRSIYSYNPFGYINDSGVGAKDPAQTDAFMTYQRAALGPYSILQNDSLRESFIIPSFASSVGGVYTQIIAHGPPWSIQGAGNANVAVTVKPTSDPATWYPGRLTPCIQWVADHGGHAFELPSHYASSPEFFFATEGTDAAAIAALDAALKANA